MIKKASNQTSDTKFSLERAHERWEHTEFLYEPSLPVNDSQISEIAKCLDVGKDSEYIDMVVNAVRLFYGRKIAEAELPRDDHRARDSKTLYSLAHAMDGLNSNVLGRLEQHGTDFYISDPRHVAAASRLVIEELKQEMIATKKSKIYWRNILFQDLSNIFNIATGRKGTINRSTESGLKKGGRPCGHFFRFIRAATEIHPELKKLQDNGLASAVERAKGKNKKK